MKLLRTIIVNSVFTLNILLLFLVLYRFELDIPPWLQSVGRMHPLMLHLPIGLTILAGLLVVFRKGFKKKAFQNFLNFVICFSALTAVVTAMMGLLLSTEEGYDPTQLNWHLITGIALSLLSWWLLWLSQFGQKQKNVFNISLGLTTIVLLVTGHLGSVLTHGENFVWQPLGGGETLEAVITDSTSLYDAAIEPILRHKCMSCHNDKKAKGKLIMTAVEKIMKGGKHGPIWVAGDPEKSTLIKRIHLPEENDDHMPPSGKPQLSKNEMRLIYLWIQEGPDFTTAWTKYGVQDSLRQLANESIQQQRHSATIHYTFPFASQETILQLNTPSCTVAQFALTEPALQADFYLGQSFTAKQLEELLKVKEQLVVLNLARMPVTDAEGKLIGQFKNLEKLNLNQTAVSGNILSSFKELKNLKSLSLAGTTVEASSLKALDGLASLTQVFLWNTKVRAEEIAGLQKQTPTITWDIGYQPHEIIRLTPPILVNESFLLGENELLRLKHNLPGAQIRYTLDGSDPDSVAGMIYKAPVPISKYTQVKTRSYKEGWYGSPITQYYFFKKGFQPISAELINPPNKDYKGEGSATLIDNKKGPSDNQRDIAWVAFREKPLEAVFELDAAAAVKTFTLSYYDNYGSYIFPPASIELWAGNDRAHLKLLHRVAPRQPQEKDPSGIVKGIEFAVPPGSGRYYKLIAQPVARVPKWISKKPDKGWLFVDEVIFN
jgi:uncharacterized membrane protein